MFYYNVYKPMDKKLNYNEWHLHIEAELQKAYQKLKLRKSNENIQTIPSRKSKRVRGV